MRKSMLITPLLLIILLQVVPTQNVSAVLTFDQGPYAYLYYSDFTNLSVDGVVGSDEYPSSLDLYDLGGEYVSTLSWGHNNTHLFVGISARGTGWVGLGMGDVGVTMTGSDMVVGFVKSGSLTLQDMNSKKQGKPSADDDSYISLSNGTEKDGITTLEYVIPLSSEDTAGKDHQWAVNGTYGFFSAYHKNADNVGFKHTRHTQSLSVNILPSSVPAPKEVEMSLDVNPNVANNSATVTVQLSDPSSSLSLSGLKVGIYEKSSFGNALLDVLTTDDTGKAVKSVEVLPTDNLTLISLLPASQVIKRTGAKKSVEFGVSTTTPAEGEGDLRDTFGERAARGFTLFMIALAATSIFYQYVYAFVKFGRIKRLGKEEETK